MAHPAPFSKDILDTIYDLMPGDVTRIFDPFAGIGRIHNLGAYESWGLEIEREWAEKHPHTIWGNALDLPDCLPPHLQELGYFDAIVTSPCYGNRMADHFIAQDNSVRHTYRAALGRDLHEDNSGRMQWGPKYRSLHTKVWALVTVMGPRYFILNIKDHIRGGERQLVTQWHMNTLTRLGWNVVNSQRVKSSGLTHGANRDRVSHEWVILFQR